MKSEKRACNTRKYCIMNCSDSKEELKRVVLEYIEYYYNRANLYKFGYRILNVAKYLALAAIPVIQVTSIAKCFPWVVVIASSLCILFDSINELFQMKEKWILYRSTNNKLMREQRQYMAKTGEYNEPDSEKRFQMFAKNVEDIIQGESEKWSMTVNNPKMQQSGSQAENDKNNSTREGK